MFSALNSKQCPQCGRAGDVAFCPRCGLGFAEIMRGVSSQGVIPPGVIPETDEAWGKFVAQYMAGMDEAWGKFVAQYMAGMDEAWWKFVAQYMAGMAETIDKQIMGQGDAEEPTV